jgi:hypothetical protein
MFGLGIFSIVKIVAVIALIAAGAYAIRQVEEHWRLQGDARTAAKLQPKIDAANKRADDAEAKIAAAAKVADDLQKRYDAEHVLRLAAEEKRDAQTRRANKAVADLVAAVSADSRVDIPNDVGRVLDAASAFANGGDAAASGSGNSASIALPGGAATYRGTELAAYFADGPKAFRVADEGWASCVAQYNDARNAQLEGANSVNAQ